MSTQLGLRERKKQQTRQLIAESAQRLFSERGFDAVTVSEVARAADVSEGTVFNYFPTKEDLFYGQMERFEASLVEAVRQRPPGEPALVAFRRAVLAQSARLASEEVAGGIERAARVVAASPALRAREREIVDHATRALAELLAEETGAAAHDAEPRVAAAALMGAQRSLVEYVHASILAGRRGPKLAAGLKAQAERAFARLERGLADYDVKRP
jgi:AcrR family transcriptional regulator